MRNLLLGLAVIWPEIGLAQDLDPTNENWIDGNDVQFSIGFGLAGLSGLYEEQDDALLPFPLLRATYGPLTLDLTKGLEVRLWENDATRLAAAVVYNGALDLPDTALFEDLDRDDWIGGALSLTHDFGVATSPCRGSSMSLTYIMAGTQNSRSDGLLSRAEPCSKGVWARPIWTKTKATTFTAWRKTKAMTCARPMTSKKAGRPMSICRRSTGSTRTPWSVALSATKNFRMRSQTAHCSPQANARPLV